MKEKKEILIISDKKAGHESASKAIVSYISEKENINITLVYARLRVGFFREILKFLLNKTKILDNASDFCIKIFYKIDLKIIKNKPFLIISSGGTTGFISAILSKRYSCYNLFNSSLRGLLNHHFTYVISGYNYDINNLILINAVPAYSNKDNQKINNFIKENNIKKSDKLWAILIGADTKDYKFTDDDFLIFLNKVLNLAKKENAKILFTTSRRTGKSLEDKFKKIIDKNLDYFKKVVYYSKNPEKIMQEFLTLSEYIFCSRDSMAMISETITAKKNLYVINSNDNKKIIPDSDMVEIYAKKRWLYIFGVNDIENIAFKEKFNYMDKISVEIIYENIKHLF